MTEPMTSREVPRTDWNDIGSICRTFGNERQAVTAIFSGRMEPGRNFWKEAADEIERLRAGVAQCARCAELEKELAAVNQHLDACFDAAKIPKSVSQPLSHFIFHMKRQLEELTSPSVSSTHSLCAKCGCETKGEADEKRDRAQALADARSMTSKDQP